MKWSDLVGLIITSISPAKVGDDAITFTLADGRSFKMFHYQDCCESVSISELEGDLDDLLNSPILSATEETSTADPIPKTGEAYIYDSDTQTWTFYRIATIKGSVFIRWYGTSNGYYSESVSFEEITQ